MIPYSCQQIDQQDIDAVISALQGSHLTQGTKVDAFEEALAEYLGVRHVCVLNSATSALLAVYDAFGLGEGDHFLTTPITFAATANMGVHLGAKPLFCPIKPDGNLDEIELESHLTEASKVIVPVDFGGNPVRMDSLMTFALKHGLKVIGDASHALGSRYKGEKVGSQADAAVFSFHAIKPITTMEGGAVATDDSDIDAHVRLFRSHGIIKKQLWNSDMVGMGFNYRLSDVACALGISQLGKLDRFLEIRNTIADIYDKRFAGNPYFLTISIPEGSFSTRHLYPILLDRSLWCPKEEIFQSLREAGIGVQVHYRPIYQFSFYKKMFGDMRVESAEDFYRAELSIPCHQGMNESDAHRVADTLLGVLEKAVSCRY